MLFLLVLVAVIALVVLWAVIATRRANRVEGRNDFALVYPMDSRGMRIPPPMRAAMPIVAPPMPVSPPVAPLRPPSDARVPELTLATVEDEVLDPSSTVQFRRPDDHAVQLLPGRLEVLSGDQRHTEIRLVRVSGERPEVILGRERSDTPGHVTLESATVSRRHARLEYASGVWKVANLSRTNAVVVNDEALSLNRERTLSDGDRLELGEVVLRFHAR